MKANELMIGDYIMFNKNIYIIEEISKKGWVHLIYNDRSEGRVEISSDYILDTITPIPLTAEILEKNEFEKCKIPEIEYIGWRLNEEFSVELNAVDDFVWNDVHIAYVHQLQHALRLCRIDKEIEL